MNRIERKAILPEVDRIECKAALEVSDEGTITGTAWPFGSPDRVGDIITKGAFTSITTRLPMLFAHDQGQSIGVWDSVSESDDGLQVKGRLLISDVQRAREVRALIREGAATGLSIGFVTKKATARQGGGRTISLVELHEISVVPVPAHPGARITSAKSASAVNSIGNTMEDELEQVAAPDNAEIEKKFETLSNEVKSFGKLSERLDKMEAKLNRPTAANDNRPIAANDNDIEKKAFFSFIRSGTESLSSDERKALTVGTPATAGYLAPETFSSEIIKLLAEVNPIRQYAKVINIGASQIKFPRRTGSPTATWEGEGDARAHSQPSYEQVPITPHELATYTDVSNALLEDNVYNLEGELRQEFAEAFGIAEAKAFIEGTGDSNDQPVGLMTNDDIAEMVTDHASGFPASNPADVIVKMYHKLPTYHARNAVWMFNKNTLELIRTWKDSDGRYLVIDELKSDMPATLLGRPIVECPDMPDIEADAFPILFGDLQGYRIVDRVSLSVLRDPYSRATNGEVRFHARRRVGADVTNPDRFVKLKIAEAA
ncbi:phage major capsid protein [Hoeflea sp. CAU 1731]